MNALSDNSPDPQLPGTGSASTGVAVPRAAWTAWGWGLAVAGALLAATVLFWFDPARGAFFYPRCMLHATTGLQCPGCGALRGGHALLHGDWLAALRLNALVYGVVPVAFGVWAGRRWLRGESLKIDLLRLTPRAGWWALGMMLVFGVLRNFPFWPLTLLAP